MVRLASRPITLKRLIWNLVFPINCLGCGREGEWVCAECFSQLHLTAERCQICGQAGDDGLCTSCRRRTKLDGLVVLFNYREKLVRHLIRALKYQGYIDAASWLVDNYRYDVFGRLPVRPWTVTPIPLAKTKQRTRGFNQAAVLAKELAGQQFVVSNLLRRTRDTVSQTTLNKTERADNVKGCFSVTGQVPGLVLLVDDVVTTGATLGEAAKTLKQAGAHEVWAVTVARG